MPYEPYAPPSSRVCKCIQLAVVGHAGAYAHGHLVPTTVAVEHLLAGQTDLHRPAQLQGGLRDHNLVIEGIGFATEATTVGTGNYTNMGSRHFQRLGHRPVDVMWALGTGYQRDPPVGIRDANRRVLLHREMRIAFIEETVIKNVVGILERLFDIAKGVSQPAVDIGLFGVLLHRCVSGSQRLLHIRDGGQRPITNIDQIKSLCCRLLIARDCCGDRVTDEAYLVTAQRPFVLTDRQDTVFHREILAGKNQVNTRKSTGG